MSTLHRSFLRLPTHVMQPRRASVVSFWIHDKTLGKPRAYYVFTEKTSTTKTPVRPQKRAPVPPTKTWPPRANAGS